MNKLLIGIGFMVGTALISLSLPRFIAEIVLLPGNSYFSSMRANNPDRDLGRKQNQTDKIDAAISSRQAALAWVDSDQVWRQLGIAQLKKAQQAGYRSDQGKTHLRDAKKALHEGLSRSPGNPFAWARLAFVEHVSHQPPATVIAALKMSLAMGEHEPSLVISRLGLALLLWDRLSPDLRGKFVEQLATASKLDPKGLKRLARRTRTTKLVNSLRDDF